MSNFFLIMKNKNPYFKNEKNGCFSGEVLEEILCDFSFNVSRMSTVLPLAMSCGEEATELKDTN